MTAWQHCGDRLASDKTTAVVQILCLLLVSVNVFIIITHQQNITVTLTILTAR